MFEYKYDGFEIMITISRHAKQRMSERGILPAPAYGSIVATSEEILDLTSGEEFAVLDKDLGIAIIARIDSSVDIVVTVITVIDQDKIWVKTGTRIIELEV